MDNSNDQQMSARTTIHSVEEAFTAHCSTCTICSDNGGTYRLCATGSSLCAGELQPYQTESGAWVQEPNVKEYLAFYWFNEHVKKCIPCSSSCTMGVEKGGKYQQEQELCRKGTKWARKVTKRFWMDEGYNIRRVGKGTRELVVEVGQEKGKVIQVRERDIFLPEGQRDEFVGKMLEIERDERVAGGEFVGKKKTFRERFSLGL